MERAMIHELLAEIQKLRGDILNMEQWLRIQVQSYQDENTKLCREIRTLLVQTNVLIARIKHQDKLLKKQYQ